MCAVVVSILGFGLDTDGLSVTWSLLWTRLWSIGIYGCVPPGPAGMQSRIGARRVPLTGPAERAGAQVFLSSALIIFVLAVSVSAWTLNWSMIVR